MCIVVVSIGSKLTSQRVAAQAKTVGHLFVLQQPPDGIHDTFQVTSYMAVNLVRNIDVHIGALVFV